jgi:hypothetical protein
VQVEPIKPKLKSPGTKHLKLKCDILLSTSAFKFKLRRYSVVNFGWWSLLLHMQTALVGRCRLTL